MLQFFIYKYLQISRSITWTDSSRSEKNLTFVLDLVYLAITERMNIR